MAAGLGELDANLQFCGNGGAASWWRSGGGPGKGARFVALCRSLRRRGGGGAARMPPKISDFGMARMFGSDDTEINTARVAGTRGYMAPETTDGVFSLKSDVFSFGVIVLEIITGKRNRAVYMYSDHLNLVADAWRLWNEGNGLNIVDEHLSGCFNADEVLKCLKVGLLCVQESPEDRPQMPQVLQMLASTNTSSIPNPKQPGSAARQIVNEDVPSSTPECSLADGMTTTLIEGR